MQPARALIMDLFCASWSSKRALNRGEIARALNHRSHRHWMVQYLEHRSEIARLNLIVALQIAIYWLKHHANFRALQLLSGAWLAKPALAIDHARAALQHHDATVREDGLAVLAYFSDASSLDLIRCLFDHPDPDTRYRAQLAVRAIEKEMPILFVSPNFVHR